MSSTSQDPGGSSSSNNGSGIGATAPGAGEQILPIPISIRQRYDAERNNPTSTDVIFQFNNRVQDDKGPPPPVRAHKWILRDPPTSQFWTRELNKAGPNLAIIDVSTLDTTPEAVEAVISHMYGKPFDQLGITTGENLRSFLNALVHFEMDQMLGQLLQPHKLFKMAGFWELDNKYIYNLCQTHMSRETMEEAFLNWILEDVTNRRQYFDKWSDFKQLQQVQDLHDLLETRDGSILELKESVKQLDAALELDAAQITSLDTKILGLEIINEKLSNEIEDLKVQEVRQALEVTIIRLQLQETNEKLEKSQQLGSIRENKLKDISELNEQLKESQQQQLSELKEQLKDKLAQITSLNGNIDIYETTMENLSMENQRLEIELVERRELLKTVESQKLQQHTENRSTIDNLTLELRTTTEALQVSRRTCLSTEAKLKEFSELNEQLKKKIEATTTAAKRCADGAGDTGVPSKKAKVTASSSSSAGAVPGCSTSNLSGSVLSTSLSRSLKINLNSQNNWSFHTLKQDGKTDKEITESNWKSNHASYFRKLEISDILHGLNIYEVLSSLAPHITSLDLLNENLQHEWISDTTNGEKLTQFLDKFTKLETLRLKGIIADPNNTMSGLETFLQGFIAKKSSTNINLDVELGPTFCTISKENLQVVLEKLSGFGTKMPNLTIEIHGIRSLKQLHRMYSKILTLPKFEYCLHVSDLDCKIDNLEELDTLCKLSHKHRIKFDILNLNLDLDESLEPGQERSINRCLEHLSPVLTTLRIKSSQYQPINVTNIDCDWPKLRELEVNNYAYPLGILKRSPKLESIVFHDIDVDSCILHYSPYFPSVAVKHYFSNLPALKSITIYPKKFKGRTKLKTQLKEVLSRTVKML